MRIFLLPKSIIQHLTSLLMKFWWGCGEENNKIHWLEWGKLGLPKIAGGMDSEIWKALI